MTPASRPERDALSATKRPILHVVDPIHRAGIDRLRDSHDVVMPEDGRDDARLADTAVVVVRTTDITGADMARMPKLKLIVKHGSGVDNIDVDAATRRGILVANSPGGANSTAVAEGAVTLMLAVLRRVREMDRLVREDRFAERWSLQLGDLTGARLGLIGFGKIARTVARICGAGFGMEVSAYDPFVPADAMLAAGAAKVETLTGIMDRDVLSIHAPLTPGSRHLIAEAEIAAMHPDAILVNTSRGGLVDEAALAAALSQGRIRGAGIDVFEQEPPQADNPLLGLPNVVLSPHVAGVTEASMKGMALAVAEIVETVAAGGRPATLLNPNALGEA